MRVLGIDPSSSLTGVALVNDGRLVKTWIWEKTKSKSDAWNLADYYDFLLELSKSRFGGPIAPMACVEFLRVDRNVQAVRKISHFQAVSVLACKHSGLLVVEAHVRTARKHALGRGDYAKDEAFKRVKKMFPEHQFRRADKGGMDESDAIVLALAGPDIAEQ